MIETVNGQHRVWHFHWQSPHDEWIDEHTFIASQFPTRERYGLA